ncbi:glycoside hydrolase family 3 C-terminal domain-containing protein [Pseudoduganella namucuonensis]|uniref:Beta-D-glucoside glucohydrolase n=1 Tax=Pseudoduganella namucuonensis TaxID=1035707 RepID=A0A1I7ILB9_9BURK|nr:glycoside hydrolase family 3 C-terminal domain-containing protein [Pseudoduganella namucuonensis]SFU73703.1 beta-glucosidase [Pseudoduganella namucuonensis]
MPRQQRVRRMAAAIGLACASAVAQGQTASHPFQNPALPAGQRIANILSLMTVGEKIDMLSTDTSVARLGIPSFGDSEGIHGLVQRGSDEHKRDAITTTQFPQPPGMGASWNPKLVQQAAAVQGDEGRYITHSDRYKRPSLLQWGPQADLARDPRWGRGEEVYSEDPFLAGTMSTAFVKGLQGEHPKYWRAAALLKHFLANSNENGRGNSSSDFDERLFWEYYAVPFKMSFEEGGARGVMAAYNAWNGTPMGVHPILKSLVIGQWGALVVSSDGYAIGNLTKLYKRYPDHKAAVVAGLKAGLNQYLDTFKDELRAALKEGSVSEAELDAAVALKLRVTLRLGLLDPAEGNPYAAIKNGPEPWLSERHKAVSLRMALESIVLMKNAGHALPLSRPAIKSIAVIGPHADSVHWDWYGGMAPHTVTALAGIKAALGPGVTVNHARDGDDAVKAARASDVAVVVVGNHPTCGPNMAKEWTDNGTKPCADPGDGREGRDRETLALKQEELVKRVLAANPKTVMVLVSSFPFTINWSQRHVPAIVQMAHSSQDQGTALAQVLFGDYNPGGKTVSTWPAAESQLPPMMDYDIRHGRTYLYAKGKPLYPFGHGLSYTTFKYSALRTSGPALAADGAVSVDVDVANTGKTAGDSVVQLYVGYPKSKVERPRRALVGFERVTLKPGERRTVRIPLKASQLAYWNVRRKAFEVEPVPVRLMIGASSADIKLERPLPVLAAGGGTR